MRTILFFAVVMLVLGAVFVPGGLVSAQNGIPSDCENPGAEFYQPNIFVRYDVNNDRLTLVDWTTADIVGVIDTGLTSRPRTESWSPDCRYYTARLGDEYVVWDVIAGERVGSANGVRRAYFAPDSAYLLLVVPGEGQFIWRLADDQRVRVQEDSPCPFSGRNGVIWDFERGQIIGALERWYPQYVNCSSRNDAGEISVFDIESGALVTTYPNAPTALRSDYQLFYNRYLVADQVGARQIDIWDRATGTQITVPLARWGADSRDQVALSADGRYLAIGIDFLRVWDLTDPTAPPARHDGPDGRIWSARFVDTTTIETTSQSGTQRWDALTGAELAE